MEELSKELETAIKEELGMDDDEVIEYMYEGLYDVEGQGEYLILHEHDAVELAESYIKDSLWAFHPWFLASSTGIDEIVFQSMTDNGRCEGNNEAILSILDSIDMGLERVTNRAIREDGMGHFLSPYDGREIEIVLKNKPWYYYMYRYN